MGLDLQSSLTGMLSKGHRRDAWNCWVTDSSVTQLLSLLSRASAWEKLGNCNRLRLSLKVSHHPVKVQNWRGDVRIRLNESQGTCRFHEWQCNTAIINDPRSNSTGAGTASKPLQCGPAFMLLTVRHVFPLYRNPNLLQKHTIPVFSYVLKKVEMFLL